MKLKELVNKLIIQEMKGQLNEGKKINTADLKKFGINLDNVPNDGKFHDLGNKKIDPAKLGLFGLMFETIEVDVRAGNGGNFSQLELNFSYTHPGGGSNGKRISLYSKDGKTWSSNHPSYESID